MGSRARGRKSTWEKNRAMSVHLPEEITAFLRRFDKGCWALRSEGRTALLAKLPSEQLYSIRRSPLSVDTWLEAGDDCGRIHIRLCVEIEAPRLCLETHWQPSSPDQRRDLESLTSQEVLDVHFLDEDTEYLFSRRLPWGEEQRVKVAALLQDYDAFGREVKED